MNNNPEIKISEEAYTNLIELLHLHTEYNCVRFSYISSCCSKASVDIILDEIKPEDLITKYKDIKIVCNDEIVNNIKSINLIYEDSSFMLKCEPINKSERAGTSGCSNCSGCGTKKKGCSGCEKQ